MYKSEPAEICLKSTGFELALCQARFQWTRFGPLIPTTQAAAVKGR